MSGRKVINRESPYEHFDNPEQKHYQMADELRPASILYADELLVWDRTAPFLAMLGRLKPWYLDTLCEYCRVVTSQAKLVKILREKGETYVAETRNGEQHKSRPEVGIVNENRRMFKSYVGDFGLSPAAERQLDFIQQDLFENNNFIANQQRANG